MNLEIEQNSNQKNQINAISKTNTDKSSNKNPVNIGYLKKKNNNNNKLYHFY